MSRHLRARFAALTIAASTDEVRGFSPAVAGNIRIDGLYMGGIVIGNQRIRSGSNVRVGLSSQGYPFPAPTGIVEMTLRPAGTDPAWCTLFPSNSARVRYWITTARVSSAPTAASLEDRSRV